jgi:ABC-type Mn2+/Zn2+ transport system ATPase subunit
MNVIFKAHSPHRSDQPLLRVTDLSVRYASINALDQVSFDVQAGQRIAVVGPNGSGKSTLFKVIAGILKPNKGKVEIAGSAPTGHICIAYMPQRTMVDWNFPASVTDVVMMGRAGKIGLFRRPGKRDREMVREIIEMVGLTPIARRQIGQLSGGQQQRIFIARAIAQEAEIMLLDEPMSGLDHHSQEDIYNLLLRISDQKVTIMMALHDLQIASTRFKDVMLLNRNLISFGAPSQALASANLEKVYGRPFHTTDNSHVILPDSCCGKGGQID